MTDTQSSCRATIHRRAVVLLLPIINSVGDTGIEIAVKKIACPLRGASFHQLLLSRVSWRVFCLLG